MGQQLGCDCTYEADSPGGDDRWPVLDAWPVLEEEVQKAFHFANRGGTRISDGVMMNYELLQHARQGDDAGVSAALKRGAWPETRRPLVMNPQQPMGNNDEEEPRDVGMTPLMFAAQAGAPKCIHHLLVAKAKVNAIEEDGWSALHFAAKEGDIEACRTLLYGKADHLMTNSDGMTPLQLAQAEDVKFARTLQALLETKMSL
mmetsp:Transcript_111253/g.314919  ORF Transcript_111253/g.314919 Transcript_111253/m.314919 type:complete len:202 (-) Transcript_111253:177-782(-)